MLGNSDYIGILVANFFTKDAYTCAKLPEVNIILAHKGDLIKKMRECQPQRSMEVITRGIEKVSQRNEEILRKVEDLEERFDVFEAIYDRVEKLENKLDKRSNY